MKTSTGASPRGEERYGVARIPRQASAWRACAGSTDGVGQDLSPAWFPLSPPATNARRSAAANFACGRGRQRAAATRRVREARRACAAAVANHHHQMEARAPAHCGAMALCAATVLPATAAAKPVSGAVRTTDAATMACAAMTVQAASTYLQVTQSVAQLRTISLSRRCQDADAGLCRKRHQMPDLFRRRRSELRQGSPGPDLHARARDEPVETAGGRNQDRACRYGAKVSQAVRYGARREVGLTCIERE